MTHLSPDSSPFVCTHLPRDSCRLSISFSWADLSQSLWSAPLWILCRCVSLPIHPGGSFCVSHFLDLPLSQFALILVDHSLSVSILVSCFISILANYGHLSWKSFLSTFEGIIQLRLASTCCCEAQQPLCFLILYVTCFTYSLVFLFWSFSDTLCSSVL